jgi:dolichol-phosphate mannosyltransferase
MKTLVVLPSYNERDNILAMIQAILDGQPDARVTVVDDSSPDGTAREVETAIASRAGWSDRVDLVVRAKKDGRGGAVREGFRRGAASGQPFEAYVEMDCDFSHEPTALPEGLRLLAAGNDVVIGARYPRGEIIGWPRSRRLFSFFANTLARGLIDWSIADYTNGFRFYSPRAVDVLLQHEQRHKGYIYLSESLSHLLRAGMKVAAFPIRFKNRERGVSNTSLREIRSALTGIFSIAVQHRLAPDAPRSGR